MLELPEALTLASALNETVTGKTVAQVLPPTKLHRFCWFNGDPADYGSRIVGSQIRNAEGFGIFAELLFSNGARLCVNDGVNVRFYHGGQLPSDYQLAIRLAEGGLLIFTVAMYGGIILHEGDYDNEYYLKSKAAISPFSQEFDTYFFDLWKKSNPSLSLKAFLATRQRFPGIGNGVLQDILFAARLHPKRKIGTLNPSRRFELLSCIKAVLSEMRMQGGRDTEKNLMGNYGDYPTRMSKNTVALGCPACGEAIVKETYLGGAVYYCPSCQPMEGN